jgi:hypothetical protein
MSTVSSPCSARSVILSANIRSLSHSTAFVSALDQALDSVLELSAQRDSNLPADSRRNGIKALTGAATYTNPDYDVVSAVRGFCEPNMDVQDHRKVTTIHGPSFEPKSNELSTARQPKRFRDVTGALHDVQKLSVFTPWYTSGDESKSEASETTLRDQHFQGRQVHEAMENGKSLLKQGRIIDATRQVTTPSSQYFLLILFLFVFKNKRGM